MTKSIPETIVSQLLKEYKEGESEFGLHKKYKYSRPKIRNLLINNNVSIRTISERSVMANSKFTEDQRRANTKKAHDAKRGSKTSIKVLIKTALTREKNLNSKNISDAEKIILKVLKENGFFPISQKAVYIYNPDIVLEKQKIIIDVFGGGFHASARHKDRFYRRTKYFLKTGWRVAIIWVNSKEGRLTTSGISELLNFCKKRNSKYVCLKNNGQEAPLVKSYLNTLALRKRLGIQ